MAYKTLLLELLAQYPRFYQDLLTSNADEIWLKNTAEELKSRHEWWEAAFSKQKAGSQSESFSNEALELALQEIEEPLQRNWS